MKEYPSLEACSAAIEAFERQAAKAMAEGMRPGLERAHRDARAAFVSRGVGRTLFKTQPSIKDRLVGLELPEAWMPKEAKGAIRLTGMAAMEETGGRTRPHVIFAKRTKVLRFQGGDGVLFRARVFHPGARLSARPFAEQALKRAEPLMAANLEAMMQAAADRIIG